MLDVYDKLTIGSPNSIKVDFIGRGNVWINNTYDQSVINLTRYTIFQALTNTAPGQLSILGYDSDLSGIFAPFASLSAGETKQMEIIPDEKAFKDHLDYLSLNNSAAAFLRPREAVVNLDYGEISQNRKTVIAFADEAILQPLRKIWWEKSKTSTSAPYVFESEKHITIQNGKDRIKALRNKSIYPIAIVGDKISIDGEHIELPLSNEPGRNIAIIGTPDGECNHAIGMIQSIAISLALQNSTGNARFIFCDFGSRDIAFDKKYPVFTQIMENAGYFIECVNQNNFEDTIKHLLEGTGSDELVYVFALALDRWEYERDPYGQGSSLKTFVESAPAKNMHFIGWWIKASNYTSQVSGYGSSDAFNSKIFLRIDERAVQSLTNPFVKWSAQSNRALVSDSIEFSDEISFIPYSPVGAEDLSSIKSMVWN